MNKEIFEIENFNIIQDEENYYFFRALNMVDNNDIEQGITTSENGKIDRIRTDRERYEGKTKYTEDSKLTLEEIYDHIKMHYRKDTNCISLTNNSNVAVNYGRGSYKDTYVMVRSPKKEFGEKTVNAGQYMLQELYSRIELSVKELPGDLKSKILDIFSEIDITNETKELQKIIAKRYTAKNGEVNVNKSHPSKGIAYSSPKARISSYQSLNEEQLLEVNKVYAKLAVLENENILKHVIPHSSNAKLRETIGNAFSSTEVIHYGEIKQNEIIEVPKEAVDLFALIQQIDGIDKSKVEEIKRALLIAVQSGKKIPQVPESDFSVKDNISIEEMYELTEGKVEYGKANSIVKNMFYLSKSRQNAINLSESLRQVLENDSKYDEVIQYVRENGFRVEPEIISRKSGKGVRLSESVNLNLSKDEQILIEEIKKLSSSELEDILQNGGFTNIQDIISRVYGNTRKKEQIDKSKYYAEAISTNVVIDKPDINQSDINFCVAADNELSFGLLAIKSVGRNILQQIIAERSKNGRYKTLTDFLKRNPDIEKSAMTALIKAGAFDSICQKSRKAMVSAIEADILKGIRKEQSSIIPGQISLFNIISEEQENLDITDSFNDMREYSKKELLRAEKEAVGFYLSGSPLDEYTLYINRACNVTCSVFSSGEDADEDSYDSPFDETPEENYDIPDVVKIAGILTSVKKIVTKKGSQMAFITIEDRTGDLSVTVFPKQYEKFAGILTDEHIDDVIYVEGKYDSDTDNSSLIADKITDLNMLPKTIFLKFRDMQEYMNNKEYIEKFISKNEGTNDNIYIYLDFNKQCKMIKGCIRYNPDGFAELQDKFSDENVQVRI